VIRYLRALSSLGYIDTHELWMIDGKGKTIENREIACDMLDRLKNKLKVLSDRISIIKAREKINTVISFIQKNRELILTDNKLNMNGSRFKTNMRSSFTHQKEYDELMKNNDNKLLFKEKIGESYNNGKISIYEVDSLLRELETGNAAIESKG
jgi:hypothetical protein